MDNEHMSNIAQQIRKERIVPCTLKFNKTMSLKITYGVCAKVCIYI
jgi:hypothetical protein